tara:strand:- start:2001 stop:8330 length:6330 start_codon:yes stop_codon:yes gene_type:complete
MPQQQKNQYVYEYQGYQLTFEGYEKPSEIDIQKAYTEALSQQDQQSDPIMSMPYLQVGDVETEDNRNKRNAEEIDFQPDKIYKDGTFWERFGEATFNALPFVEAGESQYTEADESWEIAAAASGGITGSVVGMVGANVMIGGVATPLKAPAFMAKMKKYNDLLNQAKTAKKAGNTAASARLLNQAQNIQRKNPELWKQSYLAKEGFVAKGLLGGSQMYRTAITNMAVKSPRAARAANLFISNAGTFATYGQTKIFPEGNSLDKFQTRMNQMGKDIKTSLIFSAAALPTPLGLTGKAVKYGVEPSLVFGAGAYSDLGEENLTAEERLIHGATFLAFHSITRGLNAKQAKNHIETAFRVNDPKLSESKMRDVMDSKSMNSLIKDVQTFVEKNPKYLLFTERADANNVIKLIRSEPSKKKGEEPKMVYQDLNNGKVNTLPKKDFFRKFSKNVVDRRGEEEFAKDLTEQESSDIKRLDAHELQLRDALESNRYGEAVPMKMRDVDSELISPFKKKVGLDEVDKLGKKIEKVNEEIYQFRASNKNIFSEPEWATKNPVVKKRLDAFEKQKNTLNIQINEAYGKVYESTVANFDPSTDKFKIGDYVKIPKFDEANKILDFSESGIGQYIGTMKDFKPGEVIAPEWMQKEPTRYTNYFTNIPVFEVKTNKGNESIKVAVGGKIPNKVNEAIESANNADRPLTQYAINNPKMINITQNPIVTESGSGGMFSEVSFNEKSYLFKTLLMKGRADTPKDRYKTTIYKEVEQPVSTAKDMEAAMVSGLDKETPEGLINDFYNVKREVINYIERWKENDSSRQMQLQEANQYIPNPNPAVRAAIKSQKMPNMNPISTEKFQEIFENAKSKGFKGNSKDLYEFFEDYKETETVTVGEEYVARPPSALNKIKLSDGSKAFPRGELSPELAMRFEADNIRKISESLREQRDKEIAKFGQFKEANVSEWPDMNQLKKNQPLKKDIFESNPNFDPMYDKPFGAMAVWDSRQLDKIVQKEMVLKRGDEPMRFKTKEEALDAVADNWVNPQAVEGQIAKTVGARENILGPEYTLYKSLQRQLNTARRKSGLEKGDQTLLLREIFPRSKGSSKNMSPQELSEAIAIFEQPQVSESYNQMMSSILPPADVMFSTKPRLRKLLLGTQKLALPVYTVNMMQDSKAAFDLARMSLKFNIRRVRNTGQFAGFLYDIRKSFEIDKSDMKNITYLVDPLFKDLYPKSMDKYAVDDIIEYHNAFTDDILANMLLKNKTEVRNASSSKMEYQDLFESYTPAGEKIDLLVPYDAIRVTKGLKFRDSNNNWKKPAFEDVVVKIVEGGKVYKKQIPNWYIESLRKVNRETGAVDNGWFIIGKDRYVPIYKNNKFIKLEKHTSNEVQNSDGQWVRMHNKEGKLAKPNHHIVNEFLTRSVTKEFKDKFVDPIFRDNLVEWFSTMDPEIAKMGISMLKKRQIAEKKITNVGQFVANTGAVYGTIYSRVAKLPPIFPFEKGGKRLIKVKSFKDVNGEPIKKGSEVIDINGKKKTVGSVLKVYETDYTKLMSSYAQRTSHIGATYEIFGRNGAQSDIIQGTENTPGLKDRLAKETSPNYANWAIDNLSLQVNSAGTMTTFERFLSGATGYTAKAILSSPRAGGKNLLLGQGMNVTVFGYRQTINAFSQWLRNPRNVMGKTRQSGALVAGVHEFGVTDSFAIGRINPGLMLPTEIANRAMAIAIAEPALKAHIDNLNGIKTIMNRGIPKKQSFRLLSDGLKLTDKDIADLTELGSERIHERPDLLDQVEDMAHSTTQGSPNLPFVPGWMGKQWAKSGTLFYRIAYRITDPLYNLVAKPLVLDGNPIPLLRYLSTMGFSGSALTYITFMMLDEDKRNKFKSRAGQFYDDLIRAEWLGVFSSAADEFGNVVDSYYPAMLKVMTSIANNILYVATGKKQPLIGLDDALREIVIGYGDLRKIIERKSKPNKNKYDKSKRRQNQFIKEYFKDTGYTADEADYLDKNSPYTRDLINAFWSDDPKLQSEMYWTALHTRMSYDLGADPALQKTKRKIRKKHIGHLASIINKQRPIPTSWRKRGTAKKTKYELYMSLLDEKDRASELEVEKLYQKKKSEFWKNVRNGTHKYQFDIYD